MALSNRSPSNIVALFLGYNPRPIEPFADIVISGLLSRLCEYRKNLLVFGKPYCQSEDELLDAIIDSRTEGMILVPPSPGPLLDNLLKSDLPMVAIADRIPGMISVAVDDETGTFMLAEHLALRGHRQVMYRTDAMAHESAVKRHTAFENAARFLGMEVISTTPGDQMGGLGAEEEALLRSPAGKRPTAVVTWTDTVAFPVLKYCRLHGISVPKDVAVAGFDGINLPLDPARRLTTIQAPWLLVAQKAADLLMQCIRGEDVQKETILPVDLIIGDTT